MDDHTKQQRAAERRAKGQQEKTERQAALDALGYRDPVPEDAYGPLEDVVGWCRTYRARLAATTLPGRNNRARDTAMLSTLVGIMEEQKARLIRAAASYLSLKSGRYEQSVREAMTSLRLHGFLYRCFPKKDDGDGEATTAHYYLRLEKLAEVPPEAVAEPLPAEATGLASHVRGDYSHDAYAGVKGFNPSRRKVYEALCGAAAPLTVAALARSAGMNYNTVARACTWLADHRLAMCEANPQATRNEKELWSARRTDQREEKRTLERIVDATPALHGATGRRLEYVGSDWLTVKQRRLVARRANPLPPALDLDLHPSLNRKDQEIIAVASAHGVPPCRCCEEER